MLINADFSQRATITPGEYRWVASPQLGVDRVMLDRIGEEKARATSIVRYGAGSYFPVHEHAGGEEIFVLSGTFSEGDEHFPTGWYLRNPPGSQHQPSSCEGAIIFVKLGQMSADEKHAVRIDTRNTAMWYEENDREICPLYSDAHEQVSLQKLKANAVLSSSAMGGLEVLILAGNLVIGETPFATGSWIRLPAQENPFIVACDLGVTIYLKTGHLAASVARGEL